MNDWIVRPKNNEHDPRWQVRLGDCTREHAESVLVQLEREPSVPDNLVLEEATAQRKPPLLRRIFRG